MLSFWIHGLNIYPVTKKNISTKLMNIYKDGKKSGKDIILPSFSYLVNYPKGRRNQTYEEKVKLFNNAMRSGFDISTKDKIRLKQLEEEYKVKMKDEDHQIIAERKSASVTGTLLSNVNYVLVRCFQLKR